MIYYKNIFFSFLYNEYWRSYYQFWKALFSKIEIGPFGPTLSSRLHESKIGLFYSFLQIRKVLLITINSVSFFFSKPHGDGLYNNFFTKVYVGCSSTLVPLLPFSVQEWHTSQRRLLLLAFFSETYSWFLELPLRNVIGVFASLHCSWSIRPSQYLRKEKARLSLKIPWIMSPLHR